MQADKIIQKLEKRGTSLKQLAQQLKVTPTFLVAVITRRILNQDIAETIAAQLDMPLLCVFNDVPEYQAMELVVSNG